MSTGFSSGGSLLISCRTLDMNFCSSIETNAFLIVLGFLGCSGFFSITTSSSMGLTVSSIISSSTGSVIGMSVRGAKSSSSASTFLLPSSISFFIQSDTSSVISSDGSSSFGFVVFCDFSESSFSLVSDKD